MIDKLLTQSQVFHIDRKKERKERIQNAIQYTKPFLIPRSKEKRRDGERRAFEERSSLPAFCFGLRLCFNQESNLNSPTSVTGSRNLASDQKDQLSPSLVKPCFRALALLTLIYLRQELLLGIGIKFLLQQGLGLGELLSGLFPRLESDLYIII